MAVGVFGGKCINEHSAMIFDRGGQRSLGPLLDISKIQWERARDATSQATLRIQGDACSGQADFLGSIRSHRHELVIFRGDQRVWEGPIHRVGLYGFYAEIAAKDVSEYIFRTPVTQTYDNSTAGDGATTVTGRIEAIIAHELTTNRVQKDQYGNDVTVVAWENLDPPINVLEHLVVWPSRTKPGRARRPCHSR